MHFLYFYYTFTYICFGCGPAIIRGTLATTDTQSQPQQDTSNNRHCHNHNKTLATTDTQSQPQQDTSNNRMQMSTSNKKTICHQFQQFLTILTTLMF
jgi:hypothetical protein